MRILKGTILLVFVCVFIRIAVGKPCVVPSGYIVAICSREISWKIT